ncbi:hypothetical protein [Streptomyces johnsoniae]|uniref:Uncharacterized protein n=1 Tax=Streptomyces johnsoniae TaxID=3075532 RepID=A0ABU2SCR0_9ACTN|nr:hypothetical protein [Streptomyces sp. DSM 41886]MDT0446757.1 hypothetical protein [Streptomyces sp. DSM 41886]
MSGGVLVSLEINAVTVRRGDQLMIGARAFTVRDLTALANGRKRLDFGAGESFTMCAGTTLWAARRIDPRQTKRKPYRPGHAPG